MTELRIADRRRRRLQRGRRRCRCCIRAWPRCSTRLPTLDARVLYVDDGSRDGTWAVLQALAAADPRVALLRLSRNFGKELALTAGLDHADADAAVVLDADLQDPPELIPRSSRAGARATTWSTARALARRRTWLKRATAHALLPRDRPAVATRRCRPTPATSACCRAARSRRCGSCASGTAS